MKLAVTGSTGLIGSALSEAMQGAGHQVIRLVRPGSPTGPDTVSWDPMAGTIDADALDGVDAVVNLAGRAIVPQFWTSAYKAEVLESRTRATRLIAETVAGLKRRPAVLVSASASGYYGNRGDELLTEQCPPGAGFLADVCRQWEAATAAASEARIRVVHIRTGIVLSPAGGALGRMLQFFKLGLGGKIGPGTQWWSWIALADEVDAIRHLVDVGTAAGPFNLAAPNPVTNAEFTLLLGKVLRRPAALTVPKLALLALGEFADEVLLASQRMASTRLQEAGYTFHSPDLLEALTSLLAA